MIETPHVLENEVQPERSKPPYRKTMCHGCPFRNDANGRDDLIVLAEIAPDEWWPCHDADPDGLLCTVGCRGQQLVAENTELSVTVP